MSIKSRLAGKIALKNPCPHDLAIIFMLVAEQIETGEVKNYAIRTEKNSDSQILYSIGKKDMSPIAVMHDNRVSPMPPLLETTGPDATLRMMELDFSLRQIAIELKPA